MTTTTTNQVRVSRVDVSALLAVALSALSIEPRVLLRNTVRTLTQVPPTTFRTSGNRSQAFRTGHLPITGPKIRASPLCLARVLDPSHTLTIIIILFLTEIIIGVSAHLTGVLDPSGSPSDFRLLVFVSFPLKEIHIALNQLHPLGERGRIVVLAPKEQL